MSERYTAGNVQVVEHYFNCPLDYNSDERGPENTVQVFVRECSRVGAGPVQRGYVVFLQGGPGFECSQIVPSYSGMLKVLLDKFDVNVLYIDQRGTGLSTTLDAQTLRLQGSEDAQLKYCKFFRADSIVRDCEVVREAMTRHHTYKRWTLLGQSFGGFCAMTYLSLFPNSLRAVIITGGIAPIIHDQPDIVYEHLVHKLLRRNELYYQKYPQDIGRVRAIVDFLDHANMTSLNGGMLTSRRFRQIGLDLGMHGGFDRIHNIIHRMSCDLDLFGSFTYKTLEILDQGTSFDGNPIYSLLHESIYCQNGQRSNWSSQRVLSRHAQLQETVTGEGPIYLYGENIFDWMFDDYAQLQDLKGLAHKLAREEWDSLYDLERLKNNQVPIVSSVYIDDMYVHVDLAIETLGSLGSSKELITNRYLHNALRHSPDELLVYLQTLLKELESEKTNARECHR